MEKAAGLCCSVAALLRLPRSNFCTSSSRPWRAGAQPSMRARPCGSAPGRRTRAVAPGPELGETQKAPGRRRHQLVHADRQRQGRRIKPLGAPRHLPPRLPRIDCGRRARPERTPARSCSPRPRTRGDAGCQHWEPKCRQRRLFSVRAAGAPCCTCQRAPPVGCAAPDRDHDAARACRTGVTASHPRTADP